MHLVVYAAGARSACAPRDLPASVRVFRYFARFFADISEQCKPKRRKSAAEVAPVAALSPVAKAAVDTASEDEQHFPREELARELDQKILLTNVTIAIASTRACMRCSVATCAKCVRLA